jgi:hypothetical protein
MLGNARRTGVSASRHREAALAAVAIQSNWIASGFASLAVAMTVVSNLLLDALSS